MAVCRKCHQLVRDDQVICPHCFVPQRPTTPLMRRPLAIAALLTLLAFMAIAVRWLILRFP
jgi:hypothetical protein